MTTKQKQLFIFDKDGTICQSKSGQKFINSVADQQLIPGVAEKCAELREAGHLLAVASNQGGVAWGFMSHRTAWEIVKHASDLINAIDWAFCPHHPDVPLDKITAENKPYAIKCACRKPSPEMILYLADCWGTSLERVTYIGDLETDRQAAEAAGVAFEWAWRFFGRVEPEEAK